MLPHDPLERNIIVLLKTLKPNDASRTGIPFAVNLPFRAPEVLPCAVRLTAKPPLIHHQGIISPSSRDLASGVAFDRSSLRRIGPYASVVTPQRLASNALLVIRRTA
jgi:hypothetical protein